MKIYEKYNNESLEFEAQWTKYLHWMIVSIQNFYICSSIIVI